MSSAAEEEEDATTTTSPTPPTPPPPPPQQHTRSPLEERLDANSCGGNGQRTNGGCGDQSPRKDGVVEESSPVTDVNSSNGHPNDRNNNNNNNNNSKPSAESKQPETNSELQTDGDQDLSKTAEKKVVDEEMPVERVKKELEETDVESTVMRNTKESLDEMPRSAFASELINNIRNSRNSLLGNNHHHCSEISDEVAGKNKEVSAEDRWW